MPKPVFARAGLRVRSGAPECVEFMQHFAPLAPDLFALEIRGLVKNFDRRAVDRSTGRPIEPILVDATTGQPISSATVRLRPGPAAGPEIYARTAMLRARRALGRRRRFRIGSQILV